MTTNAIDPSLTIDKLLRMGPMPAVTNTHGIYQQLRDHDPFFEMTDIIGGMSSTSGRSFLVTRYDDVKYILKHNELFSNDILQRTMSVVMGPNVTGMDGKEHLKHRTLITPSITHRAMQDKSFSQSIAKVAHALIDELIIRGEKTGRADLHQDFCFPFPLTFFVSILGLPPGDVDQVHRWGIDLTLVAFDPERGLAASASLENYLTPIVGDKRSALREDLISTLISAEVDGESLSDYEIVSFLRLLVVAGAETTNHLLGTALYALLRDRELLTRVTQNRDLVVPLIHEALRWESPVGTVMREAVVDVEVHGIRLPRGAGLLCHLGSANRDERRFNRPDVFDIDRKDNDHIAFGYGPHYCAGSHLAKLEAEIGLNAILDRLTDIELQMDQSNIIGFSFRGPDKLPVTFRPT